MKKILLVFLALSFMVLAQYPMSRPPHRGGHGPGPVFHHNVRPIPPPPPRIVYPAPAPRPYYYKHYCYPKYMHTRDWTIFGLSLFSDLLTASIIASNVNRPAVIQPPVVYTVPAPVVTTPVVVEPVNSIVPSSVTILPSPPMVIEERWLVYPDGRRVRVK